LKKDAEDAKAADVEDAKAADAKGAKVADAKVAKAADAEDEKAADAKVADADESRPFGDSETGTTQQTRDQEQADGMDGPSKRTYKFPKRAPKRAPKTAAAPAAPSPELQASELSPLGPEVAGIGPPSIPR